MVRNSVTAILLGLGAASCGTGGQVAELGNPSAQSYIVEAISVASAGASVREVGGEVLYDLPIIDGVAARLTEKQREHLAKQTGIRQIGRAHV